MLRNKDHPDFPRKSRLFRSIINKQNPKFCERFLPRISGFWFAQFAQMTSGIFVKCFLGSGCNVAQNGLKECPCAQEEYVLFHSPR